MTQRSALAQRLLAIGACLVALAQSASGVSAQSLPPGGFGVPPYQPPTVPAQNLMLNSGFEAPTSSYGNPGAPWVRGGDMVITSLPNQFDRYGTPHCGTNVLATGGNYGPAPSTGNAFAFQEVAIPATAPQPVLSFYALMHTAIPTLWLQFGFPVDILSVQIATATGRNLIGQSLRTLATLSTWSAPNNWVHEGNFDLSAFKGQTVQVLIQSLVLNPPPYTTNFAVDDVTLWTSPPVYTGC